MDSIALLLDKILYEYEWDGVNAKYLDTEYQFHLEYFKETIKKMTNHIDGFFKSTKDELLEIFERLCQMPRFTLSIIKEFGSFILLNKEVAERLFNHFERLNPDQLENNIVISYLKSLYQNNHEQYIDACEDILRFVMNDVLTFANHDLQKEIGNRILEIEGYDLLIDLFSKDYNTFLFVCFPISTFPPEYKEIMRLELEKAIRFYAASQSLQHCAHTVHSQSEYQYQCQQTAAQCDNVSLPYFQDDQYKHRQKYDYCKYLCYHFPCLLVNLSFYLVKRFLILLSPFIFPFL